MAVLAVLCGALFSDKQKRLLKGKQQLSKTAGGDMVVTLSKWMLQTFLVIYKRTQII